MAEVEKQPRLDSCHKARVLLSVLKCACFEHLEGEQLFTAICAGYGRFECERLLKPSGVELMNLPRSANIEVSVLRRSGDRERPKQLLYHGMVSLSQVFPSLDSSASAQGAEAAGGIEGCGNADVAWMDQPQVWENWLGLFSSDVNLKAQSPERLFQRCQEMGASGARFPRLLLRLQRLPPGVPAAAAQRALGQSDAAPLGRGRASSPPLAPAPLALVRQPGALKPRPGARNHHSCCHLLPPQQPRVPLSLPPQHLRLQRRRPQCCPGRPWRSFEASSSPSSWRTHGCVRGMRPCRCWPRRTPSGCAAVPMGRRALLPGARLLPQLCLAPRPPVRLTTAKERHPDAPS